MNNTALDFREETLSTPNFGSLMAYQNTDVLEKFRDAWAVDAEAAKDLFNEMKKFLYVASIAQQECFNIDIEEPTVMIDEMWHTFILFTREYEEFCHKYFGCMLHHMPYSKAELKKSIKALSSQGITFNEAKQNKIRKQLDYIRTTLGEETIIKWYSEYATIYSREEVAKLRRSVFHEGTAYATSSLSPEALKGKSYDELVMEIVTTYSNNLFCGTNCGVYSSCNSKIGQCPV